MGQRPLGSSTVLTKGQLWLGGGVTLVRASLCGSEVLLLGDGPQLKARRKEGDPWDTWRPGVPSLDAAQCAILPLWE